MYAGASPIRRIWTIWAPKNLKFPAQIASYFSCSQTFADQTFADRTFADETFGDQTFVGRTFAGRTFALIPWELDPVGAGASGNAAKRQFPRVGIKIVLT